MAMEDPVSPARAELAAACAILDRPGPRTAKELRQARQHLAFAREFSATTHRAVERRLLLAELALPEHAQGVSAEALAPVLDVDARWLREGLLQRAAFGEVRCFTKAGTHLFQHLDHPAPSGVTQLAAAEAGALRDAARGEFVPLAQTFRAMAAQLEGCAEQRKGVQKARALGGATAWREAARQLETEAALDEIRAWREALRRSGAAELASIAPVAAPEGAAPTESQS